MFISLSPQLEKFVQEKVQSEEYASEGEVMRKALELLAEQDAALRDVYRACLRDAYRRGLEKGEPVDGEELVAELEEITRRVQGRNV